LAHPEHLLNFDHRELFLAQQKQQAQTCFVSKKAQGFND